MELVATVHKRAITMIGESVNAPVRNVVLANVTIAHSAATYLGKTGKLVLFVMYGQSIKLRHVLTDCL